jgi:hypothetical protein
VASFSAGVFPAVAVAAAGFPAAAEEVPSFLRARNRRTAATTQAPTQPQ